MTSSTVFNFCRVTGSKKFLMSMFMSMSHVKHWMCFSESFQAHQPKECLFLFLLKQEPQMQGIIIFVHYLPWICKVWYSFHDFLYSTRFSLLSQIIASGSQCLPDFGHSGSSIMLHISSISSKRFALEDVVQTQHWYIPLFFNIPSILPGKLWQYHESISFCLMYKYLRET